MYAAQFAYGRVEFYDAVVNATYANINIVERELGVAPQQLPFQEVIIPVFDYDHSRIGLTVMDGNFCSVMPRGKENGRFLLHHVVNSMLRQNYGEHIENKLNGAAPEDVARAFRESSDFMPFLANVRLVDLLCTVHAIPSNPSDERVSEINTYEHFPRHFSVLSGIIATCMNVALRIKKSLATQTVPLAIA